MPRMDNHESDPSTTLMKLLLIGDGKVGKTHYAGMAAAAGFNVFYMDGDVGRPTLASLPKDVRSRIYAIDCADSLMDGTKDAKFIETVLEFFGSRTFRWNDSQSRIAKRSDPVGDEIWEIKPARMDHTCVFVLDSWTGLGESMLTLAANSHSVNLADTSTPEMRPVYQSSGMKSSQVLQMIRSMRSHVIVLAHPDEYAHTTAPKGKEVGKVKETERVIDWTKMIPKSTSKPNSLTMAKYFTDIGWAGTNATGSERKIDFRMSDSKISGGHFNAIENMDEFHFGKLVEGIGGTSPGKAGAPVDHWLTILTQGEATTPETAKVLDGAAPAQAIKSVGFSGLMKKA